MLRADGGVGAVDMHRPAQSVAGRPRQDGLEPPSITVARAASLITRKCVHRIGWAGSIRDSPAGAPSRKWPG